MLSPTRRTTFRLSDRTLMGPHLDEELWYTGLVQHTAHPLLQKTSETFSNSRTAEIAAAGCCRYRRYHPCVLQQRTKVSPREYPSYAILRNLTRSECNNIEGRLCQKLGDKHRKRHHDRRQIRASRNSSLLSHTWNIKSSTHSYTTP